VAELALVAHVVPQVELAVALDLAAARRHCLACFDGEERRGEDWVSAAASELSSSLDSLQCWAGPRLVGPQLGIFVQKRMIPSIRNECNAAPPVQVTASTYIDTEKLSSLVGEAAQPVMTGDVAPAHSSTCITCALSESPSDFCIPERIESLMRCMQLTLR
jgi:hypothetical protein